MKTPLDAGSAAGTFFESYRRAFEQQSAPEIADHFAFPAHIASDGDEAVSLSVADSPSSWSRQLERLLAMYRSVGMRRAELRSLDASLLSTRLVHARAHWALFNVSDELLYEFHAAYTLAAFEDRLRIVAIAHDELPLYRACLARFAKH